MTSLIDPRDALAALASLPVPLLVLDGTGEVLLANAPFRGLFDPAPDPQQGTGAGDLADALPVEERLSGLLSDVRAALLCGARELKLELSPLVSLAGHTPLCARLDRFGSLSVLSVQPPAGPERTSPVDRDPVTGLATRNPFLDALGQMAALSGRHGRMLSVLLADVDRLRAVNELRGRPAGDAVLAHFAALARATLRTSDLPARLGADEFALLLPETGAEGAGRMAARLRAVVSENLCVHDGEPVHYTVSMGLACLGDCCQESADLGNELVILAEEALARSKRAGTSRLTTLTLSGD